MMKPEDSEEWQIIFDLCEADILENPAHYTRAKAYFRLGKYDIAKDTLIFPVEIKSVRKSFGKVQFLIAHREDTSELLGKRWVDRKALIMKHDPFFGHLERSTANKEESIDRQEAIVLANGLWPIDCRRVPSSISVDAANHQKKDCEKLSQTRSRF
jgi:hypothetical protein